MAILLTCESGWIIDHLKFFENIRVSSGPRSTASVLSNETSCQDENVPLYLSLDPDLFEITEPFKNKIKGKSVQDGTNIPLCDIAKAVKSLFENVFNDPQCQNIFQTEIRGNSTNKSKNDSGELVGTTTASKNFSERESASWPKNNFIAVGACQIFFEKVKSLELPHFFGKNPFHDSAVLSSVADIPSYQFLFPSETKFYCNNVLNMENVFQENGEIGFDLIVMDPPWWNKFIRRRKRKQHEAGYEMLDDDELAKLPIKKFLNKDGIVVVWCTNAKSHKEKLINDIFPLWGVEYQDTLYWLKVTKSGRPICPFNVETKKQPYETIIFGKARNETVKLSSLQASVENPTDSCGSKVIISVPSSINSHKPPLVNILKQMYPDKPFDRKLEIFARYLIPGFVSYGNEVVKLQHEILYKMHKSL